MRLIKSILLVCVLVSIQIQSQELKLENGIVQESSTTVSSQTNSININSTGSSSFTPTATNPYTIGLSDNDLISGSLLANAPTIGSINVNQLGISNDLYTRRRNLSIPIYTFKSSSVW